jgi:hypothetical protein
MGLPLLRRLTTSTGFVFQRQGRRDIFAGCLCSAGSRGLRRPPPVLHALDADFDLSEKTVPEMVVVLQASVLVKGQQLTDVSDDVYLRTPLSVEIIPWPSFNPPCQIADAVRFII